jgi:hypothetical protein
LGKASACDSARFDEDWWPLEHIRYDRIWEFAFLKLLTGTVPSALSEISKALDQGDSDAAYRDMGAIDFSKHVLSQDQRQSLVIQGEVSGWADLGNPVRVIETLIRNRIVPSWLRKMRDVPRLFEEITGVGPFDQAAY